jgi:hypothetical protein
MQLWNIFGIFKLYLHNELKTHRIDIQINFFKFFSMNCILNVVAHHLEYNGSDFLECKLSKATYLATYNI